MRPLLISLLSLGLVAGASASDEPDPVYDIRSGEDLAETGRQRLDGDVYVPAGLARVGNHVWVAAYQDLESAGDGKPARGQAYVFEYNSGKRRFRPGGLSSDGDRLWLALSGSDPEGGSEILTVRLRGSHRVQRIFESPDALRCMVVDPGRRVVHAFPRDGEVRQTLSYTGRLLDEVANPDGLLEYTDGAMLPDGSLILVGTARTPVLVDGEEREGRLGGMAIQSIRGHLVRTATMLSRDERGLLLATGGFDLYRGPEGPRLHFVSGRAVADLTTLAPRGHEAPHGLAVAEEAWGRVAGGDADPDDADPEEDPKEDETP
jgi:hypothetical protein